MIGAMPAGLFGMQGIVAGDRPPIGPDSPFQWGQGGKRMTPDDIAMQQKMAFQNQQAGMDTSPVGSWTQGLARVAQALVGGMQQKSLDKASAANSDYEQQILRSLTGGGAANDQGTLAAMSSPYIGQGTKDALKLQWQNTHRAPVQPTEFERMVSAAGYQPGTPEYTSIMKQAVTNKANPMQAVPGVDEQGNQILRFIRPSGMSAEGGGPASAAPVGGAAPPATLPPDFDFGAGGPASQAPATFR